MKYAARLLWGIADTDTRTGTRNSRRRDEPQHGRAQTNAGGWATEADEHGAKSATETQNPARRAQASARS